MTPPNNHFHDLKKLKDLHKFAQALMEDSSAQENSLQILLCLCKAESIILRLEKDRNADDLMIETRKVAHETQLALQILTVESWNKAFPSAPRALEEFPDPGTDEWVSQYAMAKLTIESTYQVLRPDADLSREEQESLPSPEGSQGEGTSNTKSTTEIYQAAEDPSRGIQEFITGSSAAQISSTTPEEVSREVSTSEREACPVCLETYSQGQFIVQLPCNPNHRVCFECLHQMAQADQKDIKFVCPLCRGSLLVED